MKGFYADPSVIDADVRYLIQFNASADKWRVHAILRGIWVA